MPGSAWRVPSGRSIQSFALLPGSPPACPKGGVTQRSKQVAPRTSLPRMRQARLTPSPPRQVPAPPLSGTRAYSSTRSGKDISSTSIGVFSMLLITAETALIPSLFGRAPKPPLMDS